MTKQPILWLMAVLLLAFTACEDEAFDPVLRLGAASAISSPANGASFVIAEGTEDDEFASFSWSDADFGVSTQVTYTLEVDLAGNNFSAPESLVPSLNTSSVSVTNAEANNFMIGRGIAGGTAQDVEVRVKAIVGREADGNVLISAPITLNITPFEAEVVYPQLWVPGNYQGWDPGGAPGVYSVEDNGQYEGYVYFNEDNGPFKFTDAPNWDNGIFGVDGGNEGVLASPGDDITLPGTAGLYRLNADINDLTYSATATNWGLIGSATPTGWDSDTDMVYDEGTGMLSLTLDLIGGEKIKFRANDDWPINLGDNGADGELDYGGDDIDVAESGNYTVTLDLTGAIYKFELKKN
ncbi:MAG: SusE domain-containing protein [Bacteroidota bacterium]